MSGEAATVTDEQESRRCPGNGVEPCNTPSELVMESGWCFSHDPARGLDRSVAGARAGLKSASRRRRGIDVGLLESPSDALRIAARVATAVANGELSSAQGRTVLVALKEWRLAFEADVLDARLAAWEAAQGRS